MAVTKGATQDRRSGKVRRKKLPLWKRAAVRTKRLVVNSAVWLLRNAVEPVVELALDKVDHTTSFLLAPFTAPSRMHKQMRMLDTRLQTMNAKVAALRRLDAAREQEVQALKAALRKQRAGPRVTAEGKGKGKGKDKAAAKAHANGKAKSALITKPTTQHAAAPPSSSEFQQFHKMINVGIPKEAVLLKMRTLKLDTPRFRAELAGTQVAQPAAQVAQPAAQPASQEATAACRQLKVPSSIIRPVPRPFTAKDLVNVKLRKPAASTAAKPAPAPKPARGISLAAIKGVQLRAVKAAPACSQPAAAPTSEGASRRPTHRPPTHHAPPQNQAEFFKHALKAKFQRFAVLPSPTATDDEASDWVM